FRGRGIDRASSPDRTTRPAIEVSVRTGTAHRSIKALLLEDPRAVSRSTKGQQAPTKRPEPARVRASRFGSTMRFYQLPRDAATAGRSTFNPKVAGSSPARPTVSDARARRPPMLQPSGRA